MPPTETVETFAERISLDALAGHPSAAYGVTGKNGFAMKQGDVIGLITASKKARRRSRTNATEAGATNQAVITVDDASVFAVDDELTLEDGTAVGVVASINTEDNEVTCDENLAVEVSDGDAILASDGSQVAQGISDNETDGVGEHPLAVIIGGYLKESKLRGLDASAKAELGGASMLGGIYKF